MFSVPRHISDSLQKCQISVSHFTPKLQLAMGDSSIHKHIVYRIMIGPKLYVYGRCYLKVGRDLFDPLI